MYDYFADSCAINPAVILLLATCCNYFVNSIWHCNKWRHGNSNYCIINEIIIIICWLATWTTIQLFSISVFYFTTLCLQFMLLKSRTNIQTGKSWHLIEPRSTILSFIKTAYCNEGFLCRYIIVINSMVMYNPSLNTSKCIEYNNHLTPFNRLWRHNFPLVSPNVAK